MDATYALKVTKELKEENKQLKEANVELECERMYLQGQIRSLMDKLERVEKMIRQGVIK